MLATFLNYFQEAAKLHAYTNPSMSYPADVGVNAYVLIKLPIGRKTQHVTRTVARTFAPEFSHHIEVMTPLQMTRKSLDSNEHLQEKLISLAEKLEMTEAVFEVW
jgi:C2 domain-containing protein 3